MIELYDVVFYHSPCMDGFMALTVYDTLIRDMQESGEARVGKPVYVPFNYGAIDHARYSGLHVLFLDCSPNTADDLQKILRSAASVTIVDHHASAFERVKGFESVECTKLRDRPESLSDCEGLYLYLDNDHSGALLTFKFLSDSCDSPLLRMAEYVSDRDLWKFEKKDSRRINAVIATLPYDIDEWVKFAERLNKDFDSIRDTGVALLRQRNKDVHEYSSTAITRRYSIGGDTFSVVFVNAPYMWASDLGEYWCANSHTILVSYYEGAAGTAVSLRGDGKLVDLSKVAVSLGGGGHKAASGFKLYTLHPRDVYWADVLSKCLIL